MIALAVGGTVTAQSTFDFESVTLSPESYDNGSAGNGDFQFGPLMLSNVYDTAWGGTWNGFSISNITDNTTGGWFNQYCAYPGSGSGNSENYGIFFDSGLVYPSLGNLEFLEFKITNTTYAAISMRDGDSFAKQFGSPLDAYGNTDGTNGEDFFKVWIICESTGGQKDSIEFYLADYRFADSTQGYIVDTWETIDLTVMPFQVDNINFRFESSDNHPTFGMNTPAYFAIDDIKTAPLSGLKANQLANIQMYPNPANDFVHVVGESGTIRVFSMTGNLLFEANHQEKTTIPTSEFESGIYVIEVENTSGKYTNRIVIQ